MGSERRPIFERAVTVDYYRITDHQWHVRSHVLDDNHNIAVGFDLSVPDLTISDCHVDFLRQPYMGCNKSEVALDAVNGASLRRDFKSRILSALIGPQGCGNMYILLSCAGNAFRWFSLWGGTITKLLSAGEKSAMQAELKGECLARKDESHPIWAPSASRDGRDTPLKFYPRPTSNRERVDTAANGAAVQRADHG